MERGRLLGLFRTLIIGLLILSVPLALITTSIRVGVSEQRVYDYAVRNYGGADRSGIPESELLRANVEIKRYLTASDPGPLAITVRDNTGEEKSLFNARETAHMADVRGLVQGLFTVQVIAVAALLTLAVAMMVLWPPRALAAAIFYGSGLTIGLLSAIGFVAMLGFDGAWTQFHLIAFTNDLWRLSLQTDHLIQMYPPAYWQFITTMIGLFIILQAVLLAAISGLYLYLSRPRDTEEDVVKPVPELSEPEAHLRPRIQPPNPRHYLR